MLSRYPTCTVPHRLDIYLSFLMSRLSFLMNHLSFLVSHLSFVHESPHFFHDSPHFFMSYFTSLTSRRGTWRRGPAPPRSWTRAQSWPWPPPRSPRRPSALGIWPWKSVASGENELWGGGVWQGCQMSGRGGQYVYRWWDSNLDPGAQFNWKTYCISFSLKNRLRSKFWFCDMSKPHIYNLFLVCIESLA